MDAIRRPRSSVSRETRLLFITTLISLVALWTLARLRFADRGVTNPVTPVLTQLASPPVFDQLSSDLMQASNRLTPLLVPLEVRKPLSAGDVALANAALRIDAETAVALLAPGGRMADVQPVGGGAIIARDPASGLTLLKVPPGDAAHTAFSASPWSPRQPQHPRFLLAAEVAEGHTSARPVFVGALRPTLDPVWGATIWALPAGTDFTRGAFVFSTEGGFAGVVTGERSASGLVPADVLREWIGRLRSGGVTQYGELGIGVQPAPAEVIAGSGSNAGLVVTWVDPRGPAAGLLRATDLILSVAGAPASSREWQARTLRLTAGESIDLGVSRSGNLETLNLTAAAPLPDADAAALGLTMRAVPRVGVEVVQVDSGSLAARSGLEPGDIITVLGGLPAGSAADVRRMFAAAPPDRPVLLAITRGTAHQILVVHKP